MIEAATIFTGVNIGYQGDNAAISDPEQAAAIVRDSLIVIGKSFPFRSQYAVYPGIVVYNKTRGCPEGGEAAGVIKTADCAGTIFTMASILRERLSQSTLSVFTHTDICGYETRGLIVPVKGELRDIGKLWQEVAADQFKKHGNEISCGIYVHDGQNAVIQADANPHRINDFAQWELAASAIIKEVGRKLGQELSPVFRAAGFTYLRKPERFIEYKPDL